MGQAQTTVRFQAAVNIFLRRYIQDTDLADQRPYLDTAKKPYKMSCSELASGLRLVNILMSYFPATNNAVPYDDVALKYLFYNLMLEVCLHVLDPSAYGCES